MNNFQRKKQKSKIINNISISPKFHQCEYSEQNPDFCDYMEDYILSINYFDQEKFCHLFCILMDIMKIQQLNYA